MENLGGKLKAGFLAAGLAALVGCSEYGNRFARGLAEGVVQSAVVTAASEGVKKEMGHEDYGGDGEVEKNLDSNNFRLYGVINLDTGEKEFYTGNDVVGFVVEINPYPDQGIKVIDEEGNFYVLVKSGKGYSKEEEGKILDR